MVMLFLSALTSLESVFLDLTGLYLVVVSFALFFAIKCALPSFVTTDRLGLESVLLGLQDLAAGLQMTRKSAQQCVKSLALSLFHFAHGEHLPFFDRITEYFDDWILFKNPKKVNGLSEA